MALTWPRGRKKIPINLRGQFVTFEDKCCCNKILSFWWNSWHKIKAILNQNLYIYFSSFIWSLFIFSLILSSCCVCLWIWKTLECCMKKGVSNVSSHSFQPFNSSLQMFVTPTTNLPILISNYIFSNRRRAWKE
jgi:hypothetical protein